MVSKIIEKLIKFWAFKIKKANVIAILSNGLKYKVIYGKNLVTNDGDLYYAQMSAGETPTHTYTGIRLGTDTTSPTKNDTDVTIEASEGRKAIDTGYPKTNDDDSDNTEAGVDIVTWRVSYTKSEAIINGIAEGAIVDDITTPTSALCHFLFPNGAFNKTADDTLKIFVNHQFNGV